MPEELDDPEVQNFVWANDQFDNPEAAALWTRSLHKAEERWASILRGSFHSPEEDFLIRILARGGLEIALLRQSRDAVLRKTASQKLDAASAALTEAHAALMAIPDGRRESTLDLGQLLNICTLLKEASYEQKKDHDFIIARPKHRPKDNEFSLVIEQLGIIYMLKERRLPKVNYRRANRKYEGNFLEWALPHLRRAGYLKNEQACAHRIQRFISAWPLLRHLCLVDVSEQPQCEIKRAGQKS